MSDPKPLGLEATRALEREIVAEVEQIPGVLAAAVWLRPAASARGFVTGAPGSSVAVLRAAVWTSRRGLVFREDLQVALVDEEAIPLPGAARPFCVLEETHRTDNWSLPCRAATRSAAIGERARSTPAGPRARLHAPVLDAGQDDPRDHLWPRACISSTSSRAATSRLH